MSLGKKEEEEGASLSSKMSAGTKIAHFCDGISGEMDSLMGKGIDVFAKCNNKLM